jgi:hypothetical protein
MSDDHDMPEINRAIKGARELADQLRDIWLQLEHTHLGPATAEAIRAEAVRNGVPAMNTRMRTNSAGGSTTELLHLLRQAAACLDDRVNTLTRLRDWQRDILNRRAGVR